MMRQDDLITSVNQFLAASPYEACLLLIHQDPARLHEATRWLSHVFNWPCWPVGEGQSAALLDVAPQSRPSAAARWFRDTCAAYRPGPVIVSDIALLFEPSLELHPLRLLLDVSRQTKLIVAWPGAVDGDRLAYAVPEHGHYHQWPVSDLCASCLVTL